MRAAAFAVQHDALAELAVTYALAEAYATLTALPLSPRLGPATVRNLLAEGLPASLGVVSLDADDYSLVISRLADLGLTSGSIYDALHVRAAEKAGCDELVTFNERDFRRLTPEPPTQLVFL